MPYNHTSMERDLHDQAVAVATFVYNLDPDTAERRIRAYLYHSGLSLAAFLDRLLTDAPDIAERMTYDLA